MLSSFDAACDIALKRISPDNLEGAKAFLQERREFFNKRWGYDPPTLYLMKEIESRYGV